MPTTLNLKNIPEAVYERLKATAKNRRSLNREAIVCIENALMPTKTPAARRARARALRASLDDANSRWCCRGWDYRCRQKPVLSADATAKSTPNKVAKPRIGFDKRSKQSRASGASLTPSSKREDNAGSGSPAHTHHRNESVARGRFTELIGRRFHRKRDSPHGRQRDNSGTSSPHRPDAEYAALLYPRHPADTIWRRVRHTQLGPDWYQRAVDD